MKFKSDIKIQAGVEIGGSTGTSGQILSSTGTGVAWIDQSNQDLSGYLLNTTDNFSGNLTFNGGNNNFKESFINVKRGSGAGLWLKFQTDSTTANDVSQFVIRRSTDNVDLLSINTSSGNLTVPGALSASNLSGTNTGDQDLSGYALTSHNHDGDYVNVTGDTMTGLLIAENGIRIGSGSHNTAGRASLTFGEGTPTTDSMYIEYDGDNLSGDNNAIFIGSSKDGIGDVLAVSYGGNVTINGNTVWHAGNDGAGSGLDADLLDGQHASAFQPAGTYNTIIGTDTDIDTSGDTIIDNIYVTDGVITSMGTRTLTLGDLGYTGATNANYITNNNQLTNGAGYLTNLSSETISYVFRISTGDGTSPDNFGYDNRYQTFNYGVSSGVTGPLLSFGGLGSGYPMQITGAYNGGGNAFKVRTRDGDSGTWNLWRTLWHDGNFNPSSYLTTTGKAADSNLLDGINSTSFIRSDANDSFTGQLTMSTQKALIASNYGHGVYGVYTSTRLQHLWSMGTSYNLNSSGTDSGNLYGIAWSHPNAGTIGGANNLASHGMLILENGTWKGAWGGGSLRTPGDVRAPIFYDLDNTGYYLNPASTSRTNNITGNIFSGVISTSGDGQNNYPFRLASDYNSYMVAAAGNTWGLFWAGNPGARYGTNGQGGPGNIWGNSTNPNEFVFVGSDSTKWALYGNDGRSWQAGSGQSAVDFRAPIFYDSNNTGYYANPAGSSQFSAIYYDEWLRNNRSTASGLYWEGNTPGNGWHLYPDNRQDITFRTGSGNGGIKGTIADATARGYVHWTTSNEIGFLNNSRSWSLRVDSSGNSFATASSRAPIFYDNNNTAYYLNPAGQSRLGNIERLTHSTGFLVGSYNSVGDNRTKTNPIYTIGNSYKPADDSLGIMYGIGYTNGSSAPFVSLSGATGWGMYAASAGTVRIFLDADTGTVTSNGSSRAPIFYDSNNTSYYLDPASTGTSATFAGNVGIGTTSPGYKLDVKNTANTQTSMDSLTFRALSENYAGTVAVFENTSGINTSLRISDTVDDMYVVSRNGIMGLGPSAGWSSSNLNITANGQVGIGNRNPSERLHVKNGNLRVDTGRINFYEGTANRGYVGPLGALLYISSTSKIVFRTGASQTEKMRLTDDGRLLLNAPDNASATNSRFEVIGTSSDSTTNLTFKTSGRIGLGDYNPDAKITVVGTTNPVSSNLVKIQNTSNTGSVVDFRNSVGNQAGKISMPSSTTVNYGTTSDYRLKTNVVSLEDGIEKVKKLKPSRFEWIDNNIEVDGFIAHEVAEVIPEAVTGVKDAVDENNNPVYQDLDYSKIVPVLTAALKEAIQKIEQLEIRIQTLENNN